MDTSHFVLVHGACHGAWCWYKIITLLKSAGHEVTSLDMAASGIHPKQVHELDSVTDYYEPLIEFLRSLPQDQRVILVGHSLGGMCISVAMELFPKKIAAAVFVTAFMPSPDLSFLTLLQEYQQRLDSSLDTKIMFDDSPNDKPNGSMLFGPQFLATKLYQLSPPEDLSLAMSLIRPVRSFADQELLGEKTSVTQNNYGTVAKVYIVCQQDKVLEHDFQLSMIERNPANDVKVIVDADHMAMFSKPKELFAYLQEIAGAYY
ncbi:putative 3-oxolaurate decarboxylase [Medicago truncatula]|uniref:(S)-hydroxynitrile lyase n=1 Tax=Medicago truncatula TaxID=3880 RepID=G7K9E5_MEDTR|nr:salicylic acid-binding protein 2 [Medicago truncatula]AES94788.1 methyl jasmonate esterase [Medicago truncatula]RHN54087.1 putative 3-oxolaurate decarboxylase [Medicago truncatula]